MPDGMLLYDRYDKISEAEASWLAGYLLLPRRALVHIKYKNYGERYSANKYGISIKMLKWRMDITGVNSQVKRARRQAWV